jgi:hypothetical protein
MCTAGQEIFPGKEGDVGPQTLPACIVGVLSGSTEINGRRGSTVSEEPMHLISSCFSYKMATRHLFFSWILVVSVEWWVCSRE